MGFSSGGGGGGGIRLVDASTGFPGGGGPLEAETGPPPIDFTRPGGGADGRNAAGLLPEAATGGGVLPVSWKGVVDCRRNVIGRVVDVPCFGAVAGIAGEEVAAIGA